MPSGGKEKEEIEHVAKGEKERVEIEGKEKVENVSRKETTRKSVKAPVDKTYVPRVPYLQRLKGANMILNFINLLTF